MTVQQQIEVVLLEICERFVAIDRATSERIMNAISALVATLLEEQEWLHKAK
jgi:hypothetical protein